MYGMARVARDRYLNLSFYTRIDIGGRRTPRGTEQGVHANLIPQPQLPLNTVPRRLTNVRPR
jgi:hypothetical protein